MSENALKRHAAVRGAGGGPLNLAAWAKLVDKARAGQEKEWEGLRVGDEMPLNSFEKIRPQLCPPGSIPVPERTILNVEYTLTELTLLLAEYTEVAHELFDEARRDRLTRTLENARKVIAARIAAEVRSHLKVVE